MIRDIPTVKSYRFTKMNRGPFIIIFFESENIENKNLFFSCRRISEEFNDVPIYRYNWKDFIRKYPNEIRSCNDILIIERGKDNRIENYINDTETKKIFKCVKNQRYEYLKLNNIEYKNGKRYSVPKFKPLHYKYKNSDVNTKKYIENDQSEYEFPNSTAVYPSLKYIEKKKRAAEIRTKRNLDSLSESSWNLYRKQPKSRVAEISEKATLYDCIPNLKFKTSKIINNPIVLNLNENNISISDSSYNQDISFSQKTYSKEMIQKSNPIKSNEFGNKDIKLNDYKNIKLKLSRTIM